MIQNVLFHQVFSLNFYYLVLKGFGCPEFDRQMMSFFSFHNMI